MNKEQDKEQGHTHDRPIARSTELSSHELLQRKIRVVDERADVGRHPNKLLLGKTGIVMRVFKICACSDSSEWTRLYYNN